MEAYVHKNDLVRLRLPQAMADRWKAAAAAMGTPSLSEWLRGAADAACTSGLDVPGLRTEIAALRTDRARGVGNNLNQIAAALNAGQGADILASGTGHDLAVAAAGIAAMRARLDQALRPLTRRRP